MQISAAGNSETACFHVLIKREFDIKKVDNDLMAARDDLILVACSVI